MNGPANTNNNNTITTKNSNITTENQKNRYKEKEVTCILGDSIIKGISGFRMTNTLAPSCNKKIVLKSFPGANTEDMWEYIKPTIKRKPDNVILHVGTNDLKKDVTVEEVAENLIKLATSSFLSGTKIAISGLVPRNDNFSERCDYLNHYLHKACADRNITFINHQHCMHR